MSIAGYQRPGKGSRISANGANLELGGWNCNEEAEKIDTTNFESQSVGSVSYSQGMIGVQTAKWDMKGLWNAGRNFYDSPPALYVQDQYPNLKFYENTTDSVFWLLTLALILSAQNGAEVRQGVTFGASGENNGPYTRPTGSTTTLA